MLTKVALDQENGETYTVMVTATDPYYVTDTTRGSDTIEVTVTVADVAEDPKVEGEASPDYAENTAVSTAVYTYMGSDDEDGDTPVTFALEGTDSSKFNVSNVAVPTGNSPSRLPPTSSPLGTEIVTTTTR